MKRKSKFIIVILCISLLATLGFFQLNKIVKIIDFSSLKIKTENGLDIKKVKVYEGFYSINRENDAEMFNDKFAKLVFDGKSIHSIKTHYAENCYLITYDDKYYFQYTQISTYDNESKIHNLTLFKVENKMFLKANIEPGMKFEKQMNLINDSGKLRCNGPIDDEKGLFNGVELK